MTTFHRLAPALFTTVAGGRGGPAAIHALHAGQVSKHLLLIGLVGCQHDKDSHGDAKKASADVCSHCPGVQKADVEGKCPVCNAKADATKAGADVCAHCPGVQVATAIADTVGELMTRGAYSLDEGATAEQAIAFMTDRGRPSRNTISNGGSMTSARSRAPIDTGARLRPARDAE